MHQAYNMKKAHIHLLNLPSVIRYSKTLRCPLLAASCIGLHPLWSALNSKERFSFATSFNPSKSPSAAAMCTLSVPNAAFVGLGPIYVF